MIGDKEVREELCKHQALTAIRLGKYLRREVRAEIKRIAFQINFLLLFDPSSKRELERFHVLPTINRLFETEYSVRFDLLGADCLIDMEQLLTVTKPIPVKSARRALKLMGRQLRPDICRLVEKMQLLRVLDPKFNAEVETLGLIRALDTIARWHAMGGMTE